MILFIIILKKLLSMLFLLFCICYFTSLAITCTFITDDANAIHYNIIIQTLSYGFLSLKISFALVVACR